MRYSATICSDDIFNSKHEEHFLIESGITSGAKQINKPFCRNKFGNVEFGIKPYAGFSISEWNCFFNKDIKMSGELEQSVLSLHFILKGGADYCTPYFSTYVEPGKNNIWSLAGGNSGYTLYKKDTKYLTWAINFEANYLSELVNRYPDLLSDLYRRHSNDESFFLDKKHLATTSDMATVISQINNANLLGKASDLFVESKMLELFALQLHGIESSTRYSTQADCSCCKNGDVDKIHEARSILLADINNPPTIATLSKQVGLNEKKLKYGFKEVFHQTVYGCLFEYKMNLAQHLLLDTDKSVYEIGYECGYDYASHFTTAFKRRFSLTPKQFKSKGMKL